MRELQGQLFNRDLIARGMALRLRPTDVVVTPWGKSGTTWTQQIVHTLRTRGDMDFDDISRVVPWIEMSPLLGIDLDAEQRANPRAFKSHLPATLVPKGGRYINVVRNPADVLVSNFKFMEGWFLEPGAIGIEEFARETFFKTNDYYEHLKSWWPRRNDPDVLFLAYELMLKDSAASIRRIASFIGVPLDDELLALTLEHSTIEFMLAHKNRFDDAMMRELSERGGLLPPGSDSAKVREGKASKKCKIVRKKEKLASIFAFWARFSAPELTVARFL
jgi:hypothetical protein